MKADPKAEAAAPKSSPKKMIIMGAVAVMAIGAGGGLAWFFTHGKSEGGEHKEAKVVESKPVFVAIEQFTVNLQQEAEPQYLQIQMTLQVPDLHQEENFKSNMPKVRSRILLLLSSKHANDIMTPEGKKNLANEIIATLKLPFTEKGEPQQVSDVLFTSFIIQ
ncbi:MAG: flagellar basal body-associated protein FliL [Pseudomonadota bacterium]